MSHAASFNPLQCTWASWQILSSILYVCGPHFQPPPVHRCTLHHECTLSSIFTLVKIPQKIFLCWLLAPTGLVQERVPLIPTALGTTPSIHFPSPSHCVGMAIPLKRGACMTIGVFWCTRPRQVGRRVRQRLPVHI